MREWEKMREGDGEVRGWGDGGSGMYKKLTTSDPPRDETFL